MDGRILWAAEPEGVPRITEDTKDRALRLKTLGPKYVIRMAGETAKPGWIANVNPFVVVCCVSFVTRLIWGGTLATVPSTIFKSA